MRYKRTLVGLGLLALSLVAIILVFMVLSGNSRLVSDFAKILQV